MKTVTAQQIRQLVDRARRIHPPDATPSEALGLAGLLRCAHLLEEMQVAHQQGADELVALGLRPIIETAIQALYYLIEPQQWPKALIGDRNERRKVARRLGADPAQIDQQYAWLNQHSGPLNLDQMAARVDEHRQGTQEGDMVHAYRLLYGTLSRRHQHGGFGAVEDYLGGNPAGIELTPRPAPLVRGADALAIAVGLVEALRKELLRVLRHRSVL
jgi:hypothetical protein